jgi:hypothetical protein
MLTTQFIPIVVTIGRLVTPVTGDFPCARYEFLCVLRRTGHIHIQTRSKGAERIATDDEPSIGFQQPNEDTERFPAKCPALGAGWIPVREENVSKKKQRPQNEAPGWNRVF